MEPVDLAARLRVGFARAVVGNERTTLALLLGLIGDGHVLIEGVPGTAKTLFVRVLARLIGAPFRRIQFTPDLMPSDVVGTTVWNPQTATFSVRQGPIFASVLLADEINRTPPKTQAALLEAMEERQVTIDGESVPLPDVFLVCATQNPVEFEGTYPLPEAQLDRFFVRVQTEYPSDDEERSLLTRVAHGFDARDLAALGIETVASVEDVLSARRAVRKVYVSESLIEYVRAIVARTRRVPELALGASPRAGIALLVAAQTHAALDGNDFATPDDVKTVASLVLPHRTIVRAEAEIEGATAVGVIASVLATVDVPKEASFRAAAP